MFAQVILMTLAQAEMPSMLESWEVPVLRWSTIPRRSSWLIPRRVTVQARLGLPVPGAAPPWLAWRV